MEIIALILLVSLFLILSGFFSGAETGILSCSTLKVKTLSFGGDRRSCILEELLGKKQQVIILLIIGTNAANTIYSLAGENLIIKIWFSLDKSIKMTSPGFLLTTAILTPLLVIFGEIFPKSLFRYQN